jgi:MFS family permease
VALSLNFLTLAIFLFGLGLALGCDYPTAHIIISEDIPSANRGKLVIAAFGFQALGALGGTAVGCLVLSMLPSLSTWRWMYAAAILPAVAVTIGRFFIIESANWLAVRGAVDAAEKSVSRPLVRRPQYPTTVTLAPAAGGRASEEQGGASFAALFNSDNRRATIFASVPWFLQDLGTYGIGIFTPTILAAALGGPADHIRSLSDLISDVILAAKGSAMINVLLIVGIVFAVVLADKLGRIKLQIFGFIGCAVGLLIASFSIDFTGPAQIALIFVGFMLFSFMTNIVPNAQTYLLAGEVFPTRVRGMGAGFAAAFAKIGAVMTAFLFPILLVAIGTRLLLYGLVATSLLGAAVTWLFRIETNGVKLDRIDWGAGPDAAAVSARPGVRDVGAGARALGAGAGGGHRTARNRLDRSLPVVSTVAARLPEHRARGRADRGRYRFRRRRTAGDRRAGADRRLRRLPVRRAGRAEPVDQEHPARDLGADRRLQPPRPERRGDQGRRPDPRRDL